VAASVLLYLTLNRRHEFCLGLPPDEGGGQPGRLWPGAHHPVSRHGSAPGAFASRVAMSPRALRAAARSVHGFGSPDWLPATVRGGTRSDRPGGRAGRLIRAGSITRTALRGHTLSRSHAAGPVPGTPRRPPGVPPAAPPGPRPRSHRILANPTTRMAPPDISSRGLANAVKSPSFETSTALPSSERAIMTACIIMILSVFASP